MTDHPELLNASRDADVVNACTQVSDHFLDGPTAVDHDYRPFDAVLHGRVTTVLRCVWCHAVACGNYGEHDPCIEPWHHEPKPHRTRAGVTWPIGGDRSEAVTP